MGLSAHNKQIQLSPFCTPCILTVLTCVRVSPQKSPSVRAAVNTSWTALFSKCWTATGTANAWNAATARRNWRRSASAGATASTAKTISSSEQPAFQLLTSVKWDLLGGRAYLCMGILPILQLPTCLISQKEIRDQMRSMSAGHSAHTGGEESAGLRLPSALLRLHRVQEAASYRWRVLSDGGQQAGL